MIREIFTEKAGIDFEKIISQQISNTFNSYSQAINKRFSRTGKLFELPFRRKEMLSDIQLLNTILYINKNPAKHKITGDFMVYQYSSINAILNDSNLFVDCSQILTLLDNKDNFIFCLKNYVV